MSNETLPESSPVIIEKKAVDIPKRTIYVAGASSEIERAERVMKQLREAGFNVISDWPEVIRNVGKANPMDVPREQRAAYAAKDLEQVASARALLLLLPTKETIGAWCEFAYALALSAVEFAMRPELANRYILCSGIEKSIFTALADHYPTDDEAIAFLASAIKEP